MTTRLSSALPIALISLATAVAAAAPRTVRESARSIPVAASVDVAVVGGSTGAVAAAVAAAQTGASVFLAAPRPYLGDDMTATLRLWLEPGETPTSPLAKTIFSGDAASESTPHPRALAYTYAADLPSDKAHADTSPPSLLRDGAWGSASRQSVQYNGSVTIIADLGEPRDLEEIRVRYYRRPVPNGGSAFDVASIVAYGSSDGEQWYSLGAVTKQPLPDDVPHDACLRADAKIAARPRHVKLVVTKARTAARILLGEVELIEARSGLDRRAATDVAAFPPVRPLHVKKVMDDALLEAGVTYLYSCYATDVLRDAAGELAGIVMANRAGRQAVIAKTIIDATDRAVVARLAGASFRPYPAGTHTFMRTVIGGEARDDSEDTAVRLVEPAFQNRYGIIEYTLRLPVAGDDYAAHAAADQRARTLTYNPDQQFTSDVLLELPPNAVHGEQAATGRPAAARDLPLAAFRPRGVARLYVLSASADIPRDLARALLRPLALIDLGTRIGAAAAGDAEATPAPAGAHLPGTEPASVAVTTDVREFLDGTRPARRWPTVPQSARGVPVLGEYDVVVVGGGTAGAPAGIAAARQGAKTLVIEYLSGLGGVGTLGAIANYCSGNRVGFTSTIPTRADRKTSWVIEQKMEWYRHELLKAGADIWFRTIGCGALVDGTTVKGVAVATPLGRGVVLADVVVDCTGNADIAAAAGCKYVYMGHEELAMQGTGLPPRNLGAGYTNTDFTITDETDMVDVWHTFVYAKNKYGGAFDQGQLIDTRERRCIVGEHTLRIVDILNRRTHPDTVVQANGGSYDTHGFTVDPYLLTVHPSRAGLVNIPYRCMLPPEHDGLLVAGLGLSAHRDAIPLIRMQADIQNGGYAAGAAAAMAVEQNVPPRRVSIRKLQQHLVKIQNLKPDVLDAADSYPMPTQAIAEAVAKMGTDPRRIAVVFAQPDVARPLLRDALNAAETEQKPQLAFVLAMLGDTAGLSVLIDAVRAAPDWDKGWNYRAMGQFGSAVSALDKKIIALGRTRDKRALPVILDKLQLLSAERSFSHHRAAALALASIRDAGAAKPLYELLSKPGMTGHVHTDIAVARDRGVGGGTNAVATRRESIRELALARALYLCGDHQGLGESLLRAYTEDLRGHFARHAAAVLATERRNR